MAHGTKPIRTVVIGIPLLVLLVAGIVQLLKHSFAPVVTRQNASMLMQAFDQAVHADNVAIHDAQAAVSLANGAFRAQTDAYPIDGWGRRMRITATLVDQKCTLTTQSSGADGVFDTPDDIFSQQTFDLSQKPTTKSVE